MSSGIGVNTMAFIAFFHDMVKPFMIFGIIKHYLKGRGYPSLPQLQSISSAKLQELRISSGKMQIESRASEHLIPNYLNCYHRASVRIPKVFYEGRRRMPTHEIKRKSQTLPGRLHGHQSLSPPRYCAGILHRGQFGAVRILYL